MAETTVSIGEEDGLNQSGSVLESDEFHRFVFPGGNNLSCDQPADEFDFPVNIFLEIYSFDKLLFVDAVAV